MRKAKKWVKHAKKLRKVTQHGPKTKKNPSLDGIRETQRAKTKKNPSLAGIRETLSLLRKERQTHCYLRKPIQVSFIRLNH